MANKKYYEIQINQCSPNEDLDIAGDCDHLRLSEIKSISFTEFMKDYLKDDEWWVMLEISVWEEIYGDYDREYLGCFYLDPRFKQDGILEGDRKDMDKEYLSEVPKYVAEALQKWMLT
tara:strand:+ start:595 stop:948 length:354 start_codon:yes stop_codon:yes gene_type:complete